LDTALTNDYAHCELCPRHCGVNRIADLDAEGGAGVGFCGASDTMKVARIALHFWEEPPISGDSGSGCVFFSHCSLGCVYCQNRYISRGGHGREYSIDELACAMVDLQAQGALNINLVTPTHFAPSARASVLRARELGLHLPIVWNTSGFETVEQVRANRGVVDVYLSDFKYADAALGAALSRVKDYPLAAIEALREMVACAGELKCDEYRAQTRLIGGVIMRHMLLPGHLDDSKRVLKMLYSEFGDSIAYSIMNQYTPVLNTDAEGGDAFAARALAQHPELAHAVSTQEYEALLDFADELGIEDYFWQEGAAMSESFIPDFME
jgi:putative pyruvate formate lyase activating enzyme